MRRNGRDGTRIQACQIKAIKKTNNRAILLFNMRMKHRISEKPIKKLLRITRSGSLFSAPNFIYMTCFRDPISRIKSSLRFHRLQQPKVVMSWAESNSFNPASPISNGSPTVDNFYIRSLSGKSVYTKHLGQITTRDLEVIFILN